MPGASVASSVGKTDAVAQLAAAARLPGVDPHDLGRTEATLARLTEMLGTPHNPQLTFAAAAATPGAVEQTLVPARFRATGLPRFTNGRPDSFPESQGGEDSPALRLLGLPGGHFLHMARAPLVLAADARTVVRDYSSRFAGLAGFYDIDVADILARAPHIAGAALVLSDDIWPLNFCHWMADTLPRLACLGERRDVTVVVSDSRADFKRDSLRMCGVPDGRVVYLPDFAAVRADTLLVSQDTRDMPHPAFKAAPWAIDFLRAHVGMSALLAPRAPRPAKLYVSRADAGGRRILNEDAMLRLLQPLGYHVATLSGLSLAEQISLFAGARHVVGMHGAGLTGIAFAPRGARLVEILPATYGTAAFYVLAAGQGMDYASYVAHDVRAGSRGQVDDVVIDTADFRRCCGELL